MVAKYAGRVGDGFICTSGKEPELYTETLLPNVAEGSEAAAAAEAELRPDDRDEGLVRHRPRARAGGHPALGGAGADARGEDVGRGPGRDGAAGRRAAGRAGRQPLDRLDDPDEHVEKIGCYVELGFSHLVFHAPGPDQARFLQLYGEQVLPRLRAPLRADADDGSTLLALPGLPMVRQGDDLGALLIARGR